MDPLHEIDNKDCYKLNIKEEFNSEGEENAKNEFDRNKEIDESFISVNVKKEELDLGEDVIIISDDEDSGRFLCEQCGFITSQEWIFSRHENHHSEIVPLIFSCQECSYKAKYKADLNIHMFLLHPVEEKYCKTEIRKCKHMERKPIKKVEPSWIRMDYKDRKCMFQTKSSTALVNHLTSGHPNYLFKCRKCNFDTEYQSELTSHMVKQHPMEWCFACKNECCKCRNNNDDKTRLNQCVNSSKVRKYNDFQINNILWYKCGRCLFKSNYENEVIMHIQKKHSYDAVRKLYGSN